MRHFFHIVTTFVSVDVGTLYSQPNQTIDEEKSNNFGVWCSHNLTSPHVLSVCLVASLEVRLFLLLSGRGSKRHCHQGGSRSANEGLAVKKWSSEEDNKTIPALATGNHQLLFLWLAN